MKRHVKAIIIPGIFISLFLFICLQGCAGNNPLRGSVKEPFGCVSDQALKFALKKSKDKSVLSDEGVEAKIIADFYASRKSAKEIINALWSDPETKVLFINPDVEKYPQSLALIYAVSVHSTESWQQNMANDLLKQRKIPPELLSGYALSFFALSLAENDLFEDAEPYLRQIAMQSFEKEIFLKNCNILLKRMQDDHSYSEEGVTVIVRLITENIYDYIDSPQLTQMIGELQKRGYASLIENTMKPVMEKNQYLRNKPLAKLIFTEKELESNDRPNAFIDTDFAPLRLPRYEKFSMGAGAYCKMLYFPKTTQGHNQEELTSRLVGGQLYLSYAIDKWTAVRISGFHVVHTAKDTRVNGFDGQLLLGTNMLSPGFNFFTGIGAFRNYWYIDELSEKINGYIGTAGIGYSTFNTQFNLLGTYHVSTDFKSPYQTKLFKQDIKEVSILFELSLLNF